MSPASKSLLLDMTLSIAFGFFLMLKVYPEAAASLQWWVAVVVFNVIMQLYKAANNAIKSEQ